MLPVKTGQPKTQRKRIKLRNQRAAVAGIASIKPTFPNYKARAATSRPTAPPERVSISVLIERAAAAPVASAAALEDADEAADAERSLSVLVKSQTVNVVITYHQR